MDALTTESDAVDDVDETDGILDVLPEELSRISGPTEVSSVITHDPEDVEHSSIVHDDVCFILIRRVYEYK